MKQRLLAAMLACLLLSGCGAVRTEPVDQESAPTDEPVIAYVPLDDRPDNVERAVYLADSLGYELAMPEADDYRTRLQDQPLNENGTQYGDRADLYEWVLAQEAAGCDRYILSLDQLLSGGLVNSRSLWESEPVTLSDGTTLTEEALLDNLLTALAADADNQVWLLESVMRLAPTVGYDHWDLEGYNALRSYGMAGRPVLEGDDLTISNIEADYRLGSDGTVLALSEFSLKEWEVAEYLSARTRKLSLSDQMLETVSRPGYENFHVLIGIDDSSVEDSIQKNEIAYLRSLLREGDALLSGVDDLAFKAIARLYLDEIGWQGANVSVRYYGGTEDQPACDYDYQPLTTIMEEHFDFFGLTEADPGAEELRILVLTQPADEAQKAAYYEALIADLNDCRKAGMPVVLIDAGNGTYGTAFHDTLTEETELGWLLSYAGFLDMAIVTGTALSHGVARYAFLHHGEQTEATERAFARTLADSILKDFCYKNVVREELIAYIRNDLGGNPDNFWQPAIDLEAVQARLERGMDDATAKVIDNLEHSNFISALPPTGEYTERGWGGVELTNYRFPWDRAFEIGMDIRLGEFTQPHEKILGFYYQ
jgi:hypothetical protein|nr:DUF4127 family protein [uncultured Oscillibacter sp.]